MISDIELQVILQKTKPSDEEKVEVLIKYIFDMKKKDISEIPITYPQDPRQEMLMNAMYSIVKQYYLNGK